MVEHTGESVQHPEVGKKKEAHVRFFERWKHEWDRAMKSIDEADREARQKLATLNADVLRRAGIRETAYGIALTSLNALTAGLGAGLGMLGGAVGGAATGAVVGGIGGALATSELGPGMVGGAIAGGWIGLGAGTWAGIVGGSVIGYQAGVELAGVVYNKFVRKIDPEILPLSKFDWLVGQLPGLNPPIVGGIRTMFEGFFGLAAKREEAVMKPAVA